MSAPVTESDTFPAAINAPDVNDTSYPTVVTQMATDLANRTNNLNRTLKGTTSSLEVFTANGQDPVLADLTLPATGRADLIRNLGISLHKQIRWLRQRVFGTGAAATTLRWCPAPIAYASANWALNAGTSAFYVYQSALSVAPVIMTFPELPPGVYISNLRVLVSLPTSHGGSLPATMPDVLLLAQGGSGSSSTIASGADTSANTTIYEATHEIVVTLNHAVQTDVAYALAVRGENAANAQANSFRIFRASIDVWYV
jgi:hypothetical protein